MGSLESSKLSKEGPRRHASISKFIMVRLSSNVYISSRVKFDGVLKSVKSEKFNSPIYSSSGRKGVVTWHSLDSWPTHPSLGDLLELTDPFHRRRSSGVKHRLTTTRFKGAFPGAHQTNSAFSWYGRLEHKHMRSTQFTKPNHLERRLDFFKAIDGRLCPKRRPLQSEVPLPFPHTTSIFCVQFSAMRLT